jgi:hypothetical protein
VVGAPWGYATAALGAVGAAWSIRRVFRIRLLVTNEVNNYWKTYVIPWADVVAVGMDAKFKFPSMAPPPTLAFWLREGGKVMAQATPPRDREGEEFKDAVLDLAPASVEDLTPSDAA